MTHPAGHAVPGHTVAYSTPRNLAMPATPDAALRSTAAPEHAMPGLTSRAQPCHAQPVQAQPQHAVPRRARRAVASLPGRTGRHHNLACVTSHAPLSGDQPCAAPQGRTAPSPASRTVPYVTAVPYVPYVPVSSRTVQTSRTSRTQFSPETLCVPRGALRGRITGWGGLWQRGSVRWSSCPVAASARFSVADSRVSENRCRDGRTPAGMPASQPRLDRMLGTCL